MSMHIPVQLPTLQNQSSEYKSSRLKLMSDTFEELVKHLLEHSIRTGDFTLKSGRKSTWFCDAKQTACRPEGILLIADAALEIIPDDITAIGGLTAGADPVAFGIAAAAARERHYFPDAEVTTWRTTRHPTTTRK